jgi:acyl carrier protein
MTDQDQVAQELMALLHEHRLVEGDSDVPPTAPVTQWLDSLGRLELVDAIDGRWGLDLEADLLGPAARQQDFASLVERIRAHA